MTGINRFVLLLALAAMLTLTACASGQKFYRPQGEPNSTFVKRIDDKSVMASTRAYVHVTTANKDCKGWEYLGRVDFVEDQMELAIPVNRLLRINVATVKSSWGNEVIVRQVGLVKPRPGHHYKFDLQYVGKSSELTVFEKKPGSRKFREIPLIPWSERACKKMY